MGYLSYYWQLIGKRSSIGIRLMSSAAMLARSCPGREATPGRPCFLPMMYVISMTCLDVVGQREGHRRLP